jgi:hypothetical protein
VPKKESFTVPEMSDFKLLSNWGSVLSSQNAFAHYLIHLFNTNVLRASYFPGIEGNGADSVEN